MGGGRAVISGYRKADYVMVIFFTCPWSVFQVRQTQIYFDGKVRYLTCPNKISYFAKSVYLLFWGGKFLGNRKEFSAFGKCRIMFPL